MKRYLSISLLFIICFNAVGFFVVFKVQQYYIKSIARQNIMYNVSKDGLVEFTIDTNNCKQFSWEGDDEFEYKGKMYDVVKIIKSSNESKTYACIADDLETDLILQLEDKIKEAKKQKNERTNTCKELFKVFGSNYFPIQSEDITIDSSMLEAYFLYLNHYQSPVNNPDFQPPKHS